MKMPVVALAVIGFAMFDAVAVARDAPLRDMDLLALNTDSPRDAFDHAGRSLIDSTDSGGGSTGARARRGVDGGAASSAPYMADDPTPADTLPPRGIVPFEDPSQPAAPTPKRPSYRWQSLVPGAIK